MDNNLRARPARPLARHYTILFIAQRHPRLFAALNHGRHGMAVRRG